MGVLDSLINKVKGIPDNHSFWNGPVGHPLSKALGLVQNSAANIQNIGFGQGRLAASLAPGVVDAAAGPYLSKPIGDFTKRILPKGALQRLSAQGIATTPEQTRQMVANMPGNLVEGVKSFARHPLESMYENPVSTAMAVIAPMANPAVSAAKVNLVNSFQPGMADLGAAVGPTNPSIEQIIEQKGGWQPGMRQAFDTALMNKDANTIRSLLPQVPPEYAQRFSAEISNALGGSPVGPADPGLAGQNFVSQGGEPQTQFNGFSQSGPQNQALNMYKALHPDASQAALDRFESLHPGGVYQQPRTIPTFTPTESSPLTQPLTDKMDALALIRALKGGGPFNGSKAFKDYMVSQVVNTMKK